MSTPRELTVEEAKEKLLIKFWQILDYWDKSDGCSTLEGGWKAHSQRDKMEGMLHSILASGFDGCAMDLPAMEIKPLVPNGDIKYHKENGQNWFPPDTDIGGSLTGTMFSIGRKHGFVKD